VDQLCSATERDKQKRDFGSSLLGLGLLLSQNLIITNQRAGSLLRPFRLTISASVMGRNVKSGY
jgi:hypothetical protein